ncbi:hypothetical protein [Streptomyces sp. BH055]|uniref:hypothetical protein n=1 Tax=Streptomyces sp. BH055 TaxID=3401173 RepID=UPI003BB4D227
MNYALCSAIGALVGVSELISRYKDEPMRVFTAWGAWFYIAVNCGAAAISLWLTRSFDLSFGAPEGQARTILQVLVSGLGAMAFLRSSFLKPKVDGKVRLLGPGAILDAFLLAAEESVDRRQGARRARIVAPIMAPISFNAAYKPLVEHCIELMQNMPTGKAQELRKSVQSLSREDATEASKTLRLGLKLMNAVGPKLLEEAVKSVVNFAEKPQGSQIASTVGQLPDSGSNAAIPPSEEFEEFGNGVQEGNK